MRKSRVLSFGSVLVDVFRSDTYLEGKRNLSQMALSPGDPYSYARPDLAAVIHINLELFVDFDRTLLKGKALLTVQMSPLNREIILDNYGLVIFSVTDASSSCALDYEIGIGNTMFGSKFTITLPPSDSDSSPRYTMIKIEYETSNYYRALHWLSPNQTSDKKPFLISNNKFTDARGIFPCQDTPSVKFTYEAKITASLDLFIIMPGTLKNMISNRGEGSVFEYHQRIPIPSYAMVIVVGSLTCARVGPRSKVYAEETYIQQSSKTFARIEHVLKIAEKLCGPYLWDEFNVCVLPPNIPEFELECPGIVFVSTALLDGDLSLISSTLARNISQNWIGSLVTCSNFKHLWLTKSFTTFIYREIIAIMFDKEMKVLLETRGYINHKNMIQSLGRYRTPKSLIPESSTSRVETIVKYVPYEKGYFFLNNLQCILGGPAVFEPFLKSYIEEFKFKSVTTDDWKKYLYYYFSEETEVLNSVCWNVFYELDSLDLSNDIINHNFKVECHILAKRLLASDATSRDLSRTVTKVQQIPHDLQRIEFFTYLLASHTVLSVSKLRMLLQIYPFDQQNCEIRFLWLSLCLKSKWMEMVIPALEFACEYCAPRFACPIFRDLNKWTDMREMASMWYMHNRWKMVAETQRELDQIMH